MNYDYTSNQLPAPCIVESGIVVQKQDIYCLLNDIRRVRYQHIINGKVENEGEGWIKEIFIDSHRSTLVVNHHLYINLQSFDYLKLEQSEDKTTYFDLIQDNRQLRLIPDKTSLEKQSNTNLDAATLEAMLTEVLSAKWDVQLDDDEYSF